MIKKDRKHFFAICLAGLSLFALTGLAHAVDPAPAVTATLLPQVLSLQVKPVPPLEFGRKQDVAVNYGASGIAPVFSVLTMSGAPICKIVPNFIGSATVEGLALGTCTLLVNQDGNGSYAKAAELKVEFQVTQAKQLIFIDKPAMPLKVDQIQTVGMAAGGSGNLVTFSSSAACKITADAANRVATIKPLAVGACNFLANQPGNVNYATGSIPNNFYASVGKGDSTLEYTSATSSPYKSALELSFKRTGSTKPLIVGTTTSDVCLLNQTATGITLTNLKTGLCKLRVELPLDANYNGIVIYPEVQITMIPQQLALSGINAMTVSDVADLTVRAGGSSQPYSLKVVTPAQCSIVGVRVTAISGGVCTIEATQLGDSNYFDSPIVPFSFSVNKKPQEIKLKPILGMKVGQQQTLELDVTDSTLPVFFSATNCSAFSMVGNVITGLKAGTCTVTATRPGDIYFADALPMSFPVTIQKGTQDIQINSAASFGRGGTTPVSATSNVPITAATPITFSVAPSTVCVMDAGEIRGVGLGTCTISASQLGDDNYLAGPPATKNISVVKGPAVLTFTQLPELRVNVDGGVVGVSSNYAGTSIVVSATPYNVCWYDAASKTLTGLAAGDCILTANQNGDTEYDQAQPISKSLRVLLGGQILSFPQIAPVALNAGNVTLVATTTAKASANLPISFVSSTPATCTVLGNSLTLKAIGTCSVQAQQPGNDNYLPANPITQDIAILPRTSTVVLSSSANPAKRNSVVTFTATVSNNALGLVGFTADGVAINNCAAVPVVSGVATCSTSALAVGSHQIVANYGGDANNQNAQSAALTQRIFTFDWLPAVLQILLD